MLFKIFPELKQFPPQERRALFDNARRTAIRERPLAFVLLVVTVILVCFVAAFVFDFRFSVAALFCLPIFAVWLVTSRRTMRRYFWHKLATRGKPICTHCGYNLTGNTSGTCPECGTSVTGSPGRNRPPA